MPLDLASADNLPNSNRYEMGFKIDGVSIPDPAVFTGAESDLDVLGERDMTGTLHRDMVATKFPLKFEYHNISWGTLLRICALMHGKPKFQFTYPSPFTGALVTMDAYVGDRSFESVWCEPYHTYIANLSFSVIQY